MHGLNITYTDENDNSQTYLNYAASTSTSNTNYYDNPSTATYYSDWSGWTVTAGMFNNTIRLTYNKKAAAYNRVVSIKFYRSYSYNATMPSDSSWCTFYKFSHTLNITLPIPALSKYTVNVTPDDHGDATVNGGASASVNIGGSVSLVATPDTDYIFSGWYDAVDNLILTSAVTTYTPTDNITLFAKFEEDPTLKASYLYEPVSNRTYKLEDGNAVYGSGTTNLVTKWTSPNSVGNGLNVHAVTGSLPSSGLVVGDIYVKNDAAATTNLETRCLGNELHGTTSWATTI